MKGIFFLVLFGVQYSLSFVNDIVHDIRKIEIAQRVYPALWEKDQLYKLLCVLKRCHERIKVIEKDELIKLEKIKDEVKKSAEDVIEKGNIPDQKVSDKVKYLLEDCKKEREKIVALNVVDTSKILQQVLKKGQKKSLGLSETDNQNWIIFIRYTFLDPICYEILFSSLKRLDPKQVESLK